MKISIITICLNSEEFIRETIESVLSQNYSNIEYILIDGGSNDGTVEIIQSFSNNIEYFSSESDNGIYSAINKGLKVATGDVIGLLHAGDLLYDDNVLSNIQLFFSKNETDLIYGHSLVFGKKRDIVVRENISPMYKNNLMKFGWFPSHQSIYFKATVFAKCGYYNENYKIAGDYEFLLRVLNVFNLKANMVDMFVVKFYLGGTSSKGILSIIKSNFECFQAWKDNNLKISFYTIPMKFLRKIGQYLSHFMTTKKNE
jgi:glycosyltransferase involved in cell wall biosynthesis